MKRTALKRTLSLTRTPMKRQRSPLPARSQKRTEAALAEAAVRARVFARDRVCQVFALGRLEYAVPKCWGPLTFHHRRKASAGGAYSEANGAALCLGCNVALEADAGLARWAHSVGLVVRRGDDEWEKLGRGRA